MATKKEERKIREKNGKKKEKKNGKKKEGKKNGSEDPPLQRPVQLLVHPVFAGGGGGFAGIFFEADGVAEGARCVEKGMPEGDAEGCANGFAGGTQRTFCGCEPVEIVFLDAARC